VLNIVLFLAFCESLCGVNAPENAQTPYSATVVINDIKYGTGYASSKRAAKLEAGMYSVICSVKYQVSKTFDPVRSIWCFVIISITARNFEA